MIRMTRLFKRLKRLEAIRRSAPKRIGSFGEMESVALGKLSEADRDLVRRANANPNLGIFLAHGELLQRWKDAIAEATVETGFPVIYDPGDWNL